MANMSANVPAAPRCAALIGPYLSGKTTLLEALLFAAGSTGRRGSVRDGNSVGDHAPEARARQMSTELNVASASFLGDPWAILDCPGSVELLYEAQGALLASDVAVVVVEPEVERALTISSLLRFLDLHQIPHMVFINKMDNANARVRDVLAALQSVSSRPLVLRQVPLRGAESEITGYVDLVSERAYRYRPGQASDLIPLPDGFWDQERETRTGLLEKLADFDDTLLEQLLEEVEPPKEEIYRHLTQTLKGAQVVPVFLGSGLADYGVRRLWKALRHETPSPQETAARLGIAAEGEPLAQVIKTFHLPHTGKLSLARVWRGTITEGMVLNGSSRRRPVAGDRRAARKARRGASRRGRRADPDGGHRHRRGADPVGQDRPAAAARAAAAGVRPGDRLGKTRRRRQTDRRHRQAGRGGPDPRTRPERRHPGDGAVGPGRYPSADRDGPFAQPAQPRGHRPARRRPL